MDGIEVKGPRELLRIGPVIITETILSLTVVTVLLAVAGILLGRGLKKRPGRLQVLTEKGVSMLTGLVTSTMGEHNIGWVPYIGTIFLSSMFGSLIGMTGFLRSTTADLAVVLTWAVMTSVIIWANSIKNFGFLGWLKGFTEPIVVMTPMNIISEIAQPLALAFRHFGNVAGGGIITMIIYTALSLLSTAVVRLVSSTVILPILLVLIGAAFIVVACRKEKKKKRWWVGGVTFVVLGIMGLITRFGWLGNLQIPILQVGIPAILSIYFDLFSGFVQAFVFCLLSMVYIAGACPPPDTPAE